MATDGKGYLIPETVDPGSYRCIKVFVPDDTLYFAAFWNAYEYFSSWLAWQRDPTHRGKDAAAVWRAGFELARAEWETGGGCGMPFLLRDDPTDPCSVEQSLDNGETWTHAFVKDGCNDSVIPTPPPYPDAPEGARDAAGNFMTNVYQGLVNIDPDCAGSRSDYILKASAYMRTFDPNFANPAALGGVYDAYCALSPEEKEAARGECNYKDHFNDIVDCYDAGGLLSDLQCVSDTMSNWLNNAASDLGLNLDMVAGAMAMTGIQNASAGAGGGGGGAGYGGGYAAACGDWSFDMDFTTDAYLVAGDMTAAPYYSEYITGQGWRGLSGEDLSVSWMNPSSFQLTYAEAHYESDALHAAGERLDIVAGAYVWAGGPNNSWGLEGGEHLIHTASVVKGGHPMHEVQSVGFRAVGFIDWPAFPPTRAVTTLKRLYLVGTGANPFI